MNKTIPECNTVLDLLIFRVKKFFSVSFSCVVALQVETILNDTDGCLCREEEPAQLPHLNLGALGKRESCMTSTWSLFFAALTSPPAPFSKAIFRL